MLKDGSLSNLHVNRFNELAIALNSKQCSDAQCVKRLVHKLEKRYKALVAKLDHRMLLIQQAWALSEPSDVNTRAALMRMSEQTSTLRNSVFLSPDVPQSVSIPASVFAALTLVAAATVCALAMFWKVVSLRKLLVVLACGVGAVAAARTVYWALFAAQVCLLLFSFRAPFVHLMSLPRSWAMEQDAACQWLIS